MPRQFRKGGKVIAFKPILTARPVRRLGKRVIAAPQDTGPEGQQEQEEQPQDEQPQEEQQQEQPQEQPQEQAQEETPSAGHEQAVFFPFTSSHIRKNRLHTSAVCLTPDGAFLVHCKSKCRHNNDGPVIGNESRDVYMTLQNQGQVLSIKAQNEKQKQYAGELVERAREGDQNAMAIIACIRDGSKAGNPRAQQSAVYLKTYIDTHPVTADLGMEVPTGGARDIYRTEYRAYPEGDYFPDVDYFGEERWASTMIANGPTINNDQIKYLASSLGTEHKALFYAMKHWRDKEKLEHEAILKHLDAITKQLFVIGRVLGHARAIQDVRRPGSKISKFNPDVGWELGE